MKRIDVKSLFYITHVDNVKSILENGILSHSQVEERGIKFTPIYNTQIVSNRRNRTTPDGKSLWSYANLYFQPRNPMLYRVVSEKNKKDIVIIGVKPDVLRLNNSFVSTGNAASGPSLILSSPEGLKDIFQMWEIITNEWWNPDDGSKRKIMAECLVPDQITPDMIHTIYVSTHQVAERLRKDFSVFKKHIIPEPHMFFQPIWNTRLTDLISIVEGDMFFSGMQTLTISVNTVGIMGKGVASRAKYQFPDVYVVYQDACKKKDLQMGRPYLYKRESYVDEQLADDPNSLPNPNSNKWFLLFATKRNWRENSDIYGIEEGLKWLRDNYKTQEIQSLAVPALGCGLGSLDWADVGPLMCKYFANMDIQVAIYLPREKEIPKNQLTKAFLLPTKAAG